MDKNFLFEYDYKQIKDYLNNETLSLHHKVNYLIELKNIMEEFKIDYDAVNFKGFNWTTTNEYIDYYLTILKNKSKHIPLKEFSDIAYDRMDGLCHKLLNQISSLLDMYTKQLEYEKEKSIKLPKIKTKIEINEIARIFYSMKRCGIIDKKTEISKIANLFSYYDPKQFANVYNSCLSKMKRQNTRTYSEELKNFIYDLIKSNFHYEDIQIIANNLSKIKQQELL